LKATTPYNQVSGGARPTLEHVQSGVYYFRRAEYDYFLDQIQFLFGTRLEPCFQGSFEILAGPCDGCKSPTFLCACEHFEPDISSAAPNSVASRGRHPRGDAPTTGPWPTSSST